MSRDSTLSAGGKPMKDQRSRRVAFLSHCLINQNAKVEGFARHAGMVTALVELLDRQGVGIVQLPCPEEEELGIGRPAGDDTRQQYDTASYRETCSEMADGVVDRIRDYQGNGYTVTCILGVNGSPSCGVDCTPVRRGAEAVLSAGKGIFMEILVERMSSRGLPVPVIGIPEIEETGIFEEALGKVEAAVGGEGG